MNIKRKGVLLIASLIAVFSSVFAQQKERYPFENEIIAYKHADISNRPAKGGILFVGSSSIRKWTDLGNRFAGKPIISRGVGGCQLSQITDLYMDSIVYPYQAKTIFVYAGDNDLASGQTADEVVASFEKFWNLVNSRQPKTRIYWMSIKYSGSRMQLQPAMEEVNLRIKKFLEGKKNGTYVDLATVLLGPDGTPDDTLFEKDRLHLNAKGYDKWEAVLKPYL